MTPISHAPHAARGPRNAMRILAAALAVTLAGCAVLPAAGPDYRAPTVNTGAAWAGANGGAAAARDDAALARWWTQLGDAELNALIMRALAANHDLEAAQARVRQARAARTQAASSWYPNVSASAGATRSKPAQRISPVETRTLYDTGFDASWEIDLFGGTRRAVEAAEADIATREAQLQAARVSLVAELAQNYVDLASAQQRRTIARDNLAAQSETLQITEWRERAGLASATDVEQARTNREQTRAGIADLEVALAGAQHRIAVLCGEVPSALQAQLAAPHALPRLPATLGTGIPAQVLTQRPDLIAAERTLAAETARTGRAIAQRYPSLNLGASFGWQAYSLGTLGAAGTLARSVAGTLAATLFDGGRLKSAADAQRAVQDQALASYQQSVLTALEEVENALIAHARAHERIEARSAAAESARNAADLTRKLYSAGLADFQKVLETERTRLSAEDSLAQAQATQVSSLIALYKSLGGGWDAAAESNATTNPPQATP